MLYFKREIISTVSLIQRVPLIPVIGLLINKYFQSQQKTTTNKHETQII